MSPEHVNDADDSVEATSSSEEIIVHQQRLPSPSSDRCYKPLCLKSSTEEHFRSQKDEQKFYGAYGHIRKKLDYSYHSHYQKQRQWLHDSIIDDILNNAAQAEIQCEPWIIITAGAQGSGKRYTIEELMKTNRLPLTSMVFVDTGKLD